MGRVFVLRSITCVTLVALALPLLGCDTMVIYVPNGQQVTAYQDLDPYQKKYYYYYYDERGQRKRVPSEWLNKQDEYREVARGPKITDLFSGIPQGGAPVFDTTNGTTDPQPGAWVTHGSVPGQELKKRNVDANVTLEEKRSGNNGNGGRDR
jgi:hypothetical protein